MPIRRPLTPSADPAGEIPATSGARLDRIDAALVSLGAEQHRLERIGLEIPLARCHTQKRYWMFLRALFSIPDAKRSTPCGGSPWPSATIR
jgi:hypothetical protein